MSLVAFQLDISDNATPAVRRLMDGLQPERILPRIGQAGKLLVMNHLAAVNSRGNKLGGERTGYYADAARKSFYLLTADGVTIGTAQVGMALHYFGGTLDEGNLTGGRQYYTVPARAEAHGHTASEFENLVVLWGRNGPYALALPTYERSLAKGEKGKLGEHVAKEFGEKATEDTRSAYAMGEVLFWLTKEIHIPADESVFPTVADFLRMIQVTLDDYRAQLARGGGLN